MDKYIRNRLEIEIAKAYYTAKRYKAVSTFAILYFEGELTVSDLGKYMRVSDHLLQIDDNHYFINYTFTEPSGAFKASQNLILYLDKHLGNEKSCIALDTFDVTQSATIVLNRLTQILAAIKENAYSRIEDENILNELFQ
ncbi:MAG: hypothetical protein Q9M40_09610 [Sulfurimonas sp.]|nr:hypothetical protein [Sulfurimonas sp.]MDQ7068187.1 hypothetical protein [Sulfurimonas sp.]